MTNAREPPSDARVLDRIRRAGSLSAIADTAITGLGRFAGVAAVALIGFDRMGHPALWIGDDRIAAGAIRQFLDGGGDPHETLALAIGGTSRATPIAGDSGVAGVIQVVATGEHPTWHELALIGAQISARFAALDIDVPLTEHATEPALSDRQREIAQLVARGCTNVEIGHMLAISPSTVKREVSDLLKRLDVTNRTELAAIATRAAELMVRHGASSRVIHVRDRGLET